LDFRQRAGFLRAELIAWKTDDGEILGLQFLVKVLKPCVLRRVAAPAGSRAV